MTSSYRGLFAHKLPDGTILSVQCTDTAGNGNDVPIDDYRHRGVQPPAESLPDQHQYKPNAGAIVGHAAILEAPDTVRPPGPPDTYLGVATHLLPDIEFLANKSPPSGIGLPMLCAHALECILKAYLSRGGNDKHVREPQVRHNLAKLWSMASADGLRIPSDPIGWVKQLSLLHDGPYYLRYATNVNGIVSPAPALMIADLSDLLEMVRSQI